MVRVGFLFAAIAVPSLFVTIVKRMIGRARPMVGGSLDPTLFIPFEGHAAYAGTPSGHVTTAFAVFVAFGTLWPRARTALLIYALLIAASRVLVIAHYPGDAFAGALVGASARYWSAAISRSAGWALPSAGSRDFINIRALRSGASKRLHRGLLGTS